MSARIPARLPAVLSLSLAASLLLFRGHTHKHAFSTLRRQHALFFNPALAAIVGLPPDAYCGGYVWECVRGVGAEACLLLSLRRVEPARLCWRVLEQHVRIRAFCARVFRTHAPHMATPDTLVLTLAVRFSPHHPRHGLARFVVPQQPQALGRSTLTSVHQCAQAAAACHPDSGRARLALRRCGRHAPRQGG